MTTASTRRAARLSAATRSPEGSVLDEVLNLEPSVRPAASEVGSGAVVGRLVGFSADGQPLVEVSGGPSTTSLAARSTVDVRPSDVGRNVVLLFEAGDATKPLLVGVLKDAAADVKLQEEGGVEACVDDERVVITGQREIVLRCGEASITLTRAGKVLIRGAYVLTRSSGVNRIKGGSVQIN